MPIAASIVGGVASAAGGPIGAAIGAEASKGDRQRAAKAYEEALAEIKSIGAPPDIAREILLGKFKQVGVLTPKMEEAIEQSVSEMANVKEDTSLRDAQMAALEQLKQRGRTGLTPVEKAELNKLRRDTETSARGRQEAILQNMQMRGMGGSGAELAAGLGSSQAAAQSESEQADRQAAMAYQNALQAIAGTGSLAGSVRSQDFGVSSAKAQAADELNRFNVNQRSAVQARNVNRENEAQQANLANEQNIANLNVNQANEELRRQREAEMRAYQAQVERARMRSAAMQGEAAQANAQANATMQGATQIGSGIGSALNTMGNTITGSLDRNAERDFQAEQRERDRKAGVRTG